ncbi:MAG: leucine-rich repeat protein [Roseburia sp.]|nr:leucine-rich repeat protein [Roseburia sp.]MCM1279122.1 leucine-rich repeat protein [Robinsoniella sp.]
MKKRAMKRWLSAFLAAIMVFSSAAYDFPAVVNAAAVDDESATVSESGLIYVDEDINDAAAYSDEAAEEDLLGEGTEEDVPSAGAADYGLCDEIQDGVILHCFDWKYNDIKAELPNIAEAGFSAIQTSPAQRNDGGDMRWYMMYQPQGFSIASNPIGTKAELQALCTEAHKYGIKVIVDVVANHLRGEGYDVDSNLSRSNHSDYWHHEQGSIDYENGARSQFHQRQIGMYDLNSEHSEVQRIVSAYIDELKSVGVDGIRWDAAKHIGLPSESCNFWPSVTGKGLWHYGEILKGPFNNRGNNDDLMKEYTTYMSVTDDEYGDQILESIKGGRIPSTIGNYSERGIAKNKLVYWAESHDTYSNDGEYGKQTAYDTENQIDRTYALLASQGKATALYFSRPFKKKKAEILVGAKGDTHFTSKEVAEVNHLHNATVGEKEYYVADTNNNVGAVCRESGATVVLGNGSNRDVTVANGGGTVKPGTYTDQISGSTWTVTATSMSGRVGDTGIAVFYNAQSVAKTPLPTISKEGGNFNDTLTLTIGLKNATSGTYQIGNGTAQTYTTSKDITIGSDMAFGDSVTITLTATDGTQTETKTYTFTKVDKVVNKAYLSLPSGWPESVKCYAYDSATGNITNGWPGVAMTKDSATGYYVYEIPENITKPRVIFYSDDAHRDPADGVQGFLFETDGSYLYKDGSWKVYTPVTTKGKVIVKYVDTQGNSIATDRTIEGDVGTSYTTTAASVTGYTLKQTPSNASGKYTSATITVTYVYEQTTSSDLDVTSSLADGTTFDTETTTITLTAKNATSATYSVDDGPTKTFTNSTKVVIGQGKIADEEVTVKVTAKNNSKTVNKTFTYNKKFSGNVANETVNSIPKAASSNSEEAVRSGASGTLASQYSTNKAGVGVEKTISVDGDLSDWNSSMLIAQGAANDDPRVYRPNSMYELPVDLYALYGAYDDNNIYLMWEMTNVQDVVASSDNYPLSQGILWQTSEFPFFIAVDTGKSDTIGKKGVTLTGGTIWNSGMTIENRFNRLISINTKGGNGPYVYAGDSNGLNATEILGPGATTSHSNVKMGYGKGILSKTVMGIDGAYGTNNNRVPGDVCNDSAAWVDFNTKGHDSSSMDFFYELSIPYDELGITKNDVKQNGIGVLLVGTMGKSAMDCLPGDVSMTDQADLDDSAGSQENNSFEKSDEDHITCSFARIGKGGGSDPTPNPTPDPTPDPTTDLTVNFGADRSSPQLNTTSLTLKAIASGGKSSYTYEFFVDGTRVQAKSSKDTYTWKPSIGNHTIKVTVTDSNGSTVSSQKAYAIEGNGDDPNPTPDPIPDPEPEEITVSFANPNATYVYDGEEKKPAVVVKEGTTILVENRDYRLMYYNYINAGDKDSENAPTVIVIGQGDYATKIASRILTYTIGKAGIPDGAPNSEMSASIGLVSDVTLNAGWEWSAADRNKELQTGSTITANAVYNGEDKANYTITTVTVSLTGISCDHIGTERETITAVAATCTQNGRQDVICKTCHKKIETGTIIQALGHKGGTATCSSQATCDRCKAKYGEFNANNHANIVVQNRREASCQQAGYTGDTVCGDCNSQISSGKPIAKTDHKWDSGRVTKAPTATTDGVRTYTCTVCGTTKTETIPKTGGNGGGGGDNPTPAPVETLKVGDPVMDTASKAIYKVTQANSSVKTVEYVLPSGAGKTVTIPDSVVVKGTSYQVTSIADGAFKDDKTIQSVKMGKFVKAIGANAFSGCSKLKKVTLPSNATTIGNKAFYKCTSLTSITIPSKISKIGSKAFYGCKKLKKITIKTTKLSKSKVGSQAFKGIAAKATIKVPKKKLSTYKKMLRARGVGSKAKIKK